MYLNSFNHFRAIAIVFIVAGHTFDLAGLKIEHFTEKVFANLLTGNTALFVFISGFLFHHIFYKKYDYFKFMKGKIKNVLIPYILLGALPIIILVIQVRSDWGGIFLPSGESVYDKYIIPSFKYYWTGRFLIAYWYIPFIISMFILSPFHVLYIKKPIRLKLLILFSFSIVAVFIHRPVDTLGLIQSVLYFTPYYLLGIICSMHKETIYRACSGKEIYILLSVLIFSLCQTLLGVESYSKAPFVYDGIDINFFQKIAMCFFLMVFLKKYDSFDNKYVSTLAATSFTVFFIHPFFLYGISKVNQLYDLYPENSWLIYVVMVVSIIFSCVFIAIFTKKILPNHSRYITGF